MQTKRRYQCADCGVWCHRKRKWKAPLVCFECGVERAARAARQMHYKAGAAYDDWEDSAGPDGRPRRNSVGE